MMNRVNRLEDATAVGRASEIAKSFVAAVRGQYETDRQAVAAVARSSRVSYAAIRSFIQPSRMPKSVSVQLWDGLRFAYLRLLRQQLAALQLEIDRVERMDPADGALLALLDDAKALARRIEAAAGILPDTK